MLRINYHDTQFNRRQFRSLDEEASFVFASYSGKIPKSEYTTIKSAVLEYWTSPSLYRRLHRLQDSLWRRFHSLESLPNPEKIALWIRLAGYSETNEKCETIPAREVEGVATGEADGSNIARDIMFDLDSSHALYLDVIKENNRLADRISELTEENRKLRKSVNAARIYVIKNS